MLNQLLAVFARSSSALCLDEISRELQAESSAVVGMLDLLVRHGRLIEVGPDGGYCAACGLQSECNLLAARGKRYVLAQPPQSPPREQAC